MDNNGGLDKNGIREAARIAETASIQFSPKDRGNYVRSMIKKVEAYQRADKTVDEIKQLLPDFFQSYPKLFNMVTIPPYDMAQVRTMLAMLDRMGTGELSQHQASVIVGQKLLNKFVMPGLKAPPSSPQ